MSIKISHIDYIATFGDTFLHKITAKAKLIDALIIVIATFSAQYNMTLIIMYCLMMLYLTFSSFPKKKFLAISFYPIIFLLFFLFSYENLSEDTAIRLIFRVLCISSTFTFVILSTPFIQIFKVLNKILPDFIINTLFNTYRSLFVISEILSNLLVSLRIRGDLTPKKPIYSLKVIGNLVGFFVIKSLEKGENMYEAIKLRGYKENFKF